MNFMIKCVKHSFQGSCRPSIFKYKLFRIFSTHPSIHHLYCRVTGMLERTYVIGQSVLPGDGGALKHLINTDHTLLSCEFEACILLSLFFWFPYSSEKRVSLRLSCFCLKGNSNTAPGSASSSPSFFSLSSDGSISSCIIPHSLP